MNKSVFKRIAAAFAAALVAVCVSAGAFAATSAPATARPQPGTSTSSSSNRSTGSNSSSSSSSSNSSSSSSSSNSSSSRSSNDEDEDRDTSSSSSSSSSRNNSSSDNDNEERTNVTPTTVAPVTTVSNKSYTTKIGAFLWFLLSVIVNTVISFAIANRFYNLARKETHVTAEIRALRHDIEEKFADNIGGFTEPEIDISNENEVYSNNADGIKMTPASTTSVDAPVEDVYKQWEEQIARRRAERRAAITTRPELDEDKEEEKPVKKYQPKRSVPDETRRIFDYAQEIGDESEASTDNEADEPYEDEIEYERPAVKKAQRPVKASKKKNNAGVAKKAKNFINNIFPLKDDEDENIDDLD